MLLSACKLLRIFEILCFQIIKVQANYGTVKMGQVFEMVVQKIWKHETLKSRLRAEVTKDFVGLLYPDNKKKINELL